MIDKTSEVLRGKSVLVTRPKDQADSLVLPLTARGAVVLFQPAIEIVSRSDEIIVADLAKLGMGERFDRIIFSSANGVRSFCPLLIKARDRFQELYRELSRTEKRREPAGSERGSAGSERGSAGSERGSAGSERESAGSEREPAGSERGAAGSEREPAGSDGISELRVLSDGISSGSVRLAAMGSGTAKALEEFGWTADLIPSDFHAEGMLEALRVEGISGRRFLSIRGSRGRSVLREGICKLGGDLVELSVYESRDLILPDPEIQSRLDAGLIDAVTVTSSAIATSLIRMFGESLRKTSLFSISSLTSSALRENGFEPVGQAAHATMEELVERIVDFFRK